MQDKKTRRVRQDREVHVVSYSVASPQSNNNALLLLFYRPFYDRQGEAINGAEEFDRAVFKHGVGPQSGQEMWAPDHGPLIHIFV